MSNLSVIIPVHNGIGFIERAISSILEIEKGIDIVVVENGSTDGSFGYIRDTFRDARLFQLPTASIREARNFGAEVAHGSTITFLDQDDELYSNRLKPEFLDLATERRIVIGTQKFVDEESAFIPNYLKKAQKKQLPNYSPISMIIQKSLFFEIGKFIDGYKIADDFEFITRAIRLGIEIQYIDEYFLVRHFHANNFSHDIRQTSKELLKLVRNHVRQNEKRN